MKSIKIDDYQRFILQFHIRVHLSTIRFVFTPIPIEKLEEMAQKTYSDTLMNLVMALKETILLSYGHTKRLK